MEAIERRKKWACKQFTGSSTTSRIFKLLISAEGKHGTVKWATHRNSKPGPAMTPKKCNVNLSYQATMPRPAYCTASASSLQKPRGSLKASTRPTRFKRCISTLLIEKKKIPHLSKDKLKKGRICYKSL
jgi:hypothetical protein